MSYKKHKRKGRPLESPLPRENSITIRLNKKEFECLSLYAWRYDESISSVVRDALELLSAIPQNPLKD